MATKVQTATELVAKVAQDPKLQDQIKADPVATLTDSAVSPLTWDKAIYRIVVCALASIVLIALVGAIMWGDALNITVG